MTPEAHSPGFLRRLGAMFYDSLLLLAILIMVSYPFVWLTGGKQEFLILYRIYLLAIIFLYYGGFWVRGGQTLGMRTWRIKILRADGRPVTWGVALKRFAFALVSLLCLGFGFFWILYDRDKLAWHDRWSGTKLIRLPKNQ
ncbi:MAG: RDD family protein [Sulfuricaulis sp.]